MSEQNTQESLELNQKQIHKISSGLCCVFGIQEGVELVYMIGDGFEDNNAQALGSWIEKQLVILSPTNSEGLFEQLKQHLSQKLNVEELH